MREETKERRRPEREEYWQRVWEAAVAIRATVDEGNDTWVLNEAEDLVKEFDRRRKESDDA